MTKWIGAAAMAVGVLGLALAVPDSSIAKTQAKQFQPMAEAMDVGARRNDQRHNASRTHAPYEPHYYARPYYYRPYPYGVPFPFVLGFGPWW